MPYLEPSFWDRFSRAPASRRFVALARRGSEVKPPPERPAGPETAQQKFDLEESLRYCREELGI